MNEADTYKCVVVGILTGYNGHHGDCFLKLTINEPKKKY